MIPAEEGPEDRLQIACSECSSEGCHGRERREIKNTRLKQGLSQNGNRKTNHEVTQWGRTGPAGPWGPGAPTFSHRPKHLAAQKMIYAPGPPSPAGPSTVPGPARPRVT